MLLFVFGSCFFGSLVLGFLSCQIHRDSLSLSGGRESVFIYGAPSRKANAHGHDRDDFVRMTLREIVYFYFAKIICFVSINLPSTWSEY